MNYENMLPPRTAPESAPAGGAEPVAFSETVEQKDYGHHGGHKTDQDQGNVPHPFFKTGGEQRFVQLTGDTAYQGIIAGGHNHAQGAAA